MEPASQFLTRDEILAILESAAKTKKKGDKGDKKKGADAGGDEFFKEFTPGEKVWIKNDDEDADLVDDVSKRPFYVMKVKQDKPKEIVCDLYERVDEVNPNNVDISCHEPKYQKPDITINKKDVMEYSVQAAKGIQDMVDIDELNPATVMHNLFARYATDQIYTYVGPTLLAVNPFKRIATSGNLAIYVDQFQCLKDIDNVIAKFKQPENIIDKFKQNLVKKYRAQLQTTLVINYFKQITDAGSNYFETIISLDPHSYAIAATAHKQMLAEKKRQGIVISGESGAGKTESAKLCMEFLTNALGSRPGADPNKKELPVGERILATNPILEAYGNSRTARNKNSSRFGKYTKMYFNLQGQVCGAQIKNYLLEKSRVTGNTPVERNYHAFFFMLRGHEDMDLMKKMGLTKPDGSRKENTDFKFIAIANEGDDDWVRKDIGEWKDVMKAYNDLGFSKAEQEAVFRTTAVCLHLGQLEIDGSVYVEGKTCCSFKNIDKVKEIAEIMGIEKWEELVTEIVNKEKMKDIAQRTPLKPEDVNTALMALAKSLFDNMFNWLVAKMNLTIQPEEFSQPSQIDKFLQENKTVGLLDIFGFENFELNQFEQLCINYVNEKLHNLYICSVFGAEKDSMEREGIYVKLKLPPMKVRKVLKLMDNANPKEGPLGLFKTVDDKSAPTTKEMSVRIKDLYSAYLKDHEDKKKGIITDAEGKQIFQSIKPADRKKDPTNFQINHSAKTVKYDVSNFIERNADSISASMKELLLTQTEPNIARIYSMKVSDIEEDDDGKGKPNLKTIWGKFNVQIQDLMDELAEPLIPQDLGDEEEKKADPKKKVVVPTCDPTDLHFIRCLKPNDKKIGNYFSDSMTLQQITYMGVLESIRVKQENFPYRYKYEDFYRNYELLSPAYVQGRYDSMSAKKKEELRDEWKPRSMGIIAEAFKPMQPEEYQEYFACGNTKLLMHSEIKLVIDRSKAIASRKYDKVCRMIKRAYCMQRQQLQFNQRLVTLFKWQKAIKVAFQKRQYKRAVEMHKKALAAVVSFKTEKRRVFEQDAGTVIQKVYRTNVFREDLHHAIQSRKFFMRGIYAVAQINRNRKIWICRRAVMQVVDRAFKIINRNKFDSASLTVQRIVRGHKERAGKKQLVLEAVRKKVELKQHVAAQTIQKKMKGLFIRRRLDFMERKVRRVQHYFALIKAKKIYSINKIKSFVKMRWTRRIYRVVRKNCIILQMAFRRYMARKDQITIRMHTYLAHELHVIENVKAVEYSQLHANAQTRNQAMKMGLIKTLTPYSPKKIHFFSRVVDINILVDLSDVFSQPWSAQWMKVKAENTFNDSPIMSISSGQTHSLAVNSKSKVFVWGWNDNGQCAQPIHNVDEVILNQKSTKNAQVNLDSVIDYERQIQLKNQGGMRIKQAIAVEDRCMLLIQDTKEIVAWGGNQRGQLGLGHYEDVSQPTIIDSLARNGSKISYIAAGGDLSLACSENGEAYAWPFTQNSLKSSIPVRMPFSEKTKILKVSAGNNFGFFISNQGLVYSFGEDNRDGQLGLGHLYPTEIPELIIAFRDIGEKIDTIECGYKHAIAKSSLGKIYTWGSSHKGQLGHDHFNNELSPRALLLKQHKSEKITQIAAGYSHSMLMLEGNKEVYWFGSSGNLVDQAYPIQFDTIQYLPDLFGDALNDNVDANLNFTPKYSNSHQKDFAIVKINCTWSKTMSLSSMVIADLRAVNNELQHSKLATSMTNLGGKWEPRDVMPPFIESVANLFPANLMRRPTVLKAGQSSQLQSQAGTKNTTQRTKLLTGLQTLQTPAKLDRAVLSSRGSHSSRMKK